MGAVRGFTLALFKVSPTRQKGGPWNSIISAHLGGQIFVSMETGPYFFMVDEAIFIKINYISPSLTLLLPEMSLEDGQIPPLSVPVLCKCDRLLPMADCKHPLITANTPVEPGLWSNCAAMRVVMNRQMYT